MISVQSMPMEQGQTTISVQRFLNDLASPQRDLPSSEIVRNLLARTVDRLHMICTRILYKEYPRLARGPMNLESEELLSAVVARMIKAMRVVHPQTVRQFFALAHQHMRWELNDLARRLDEKAATVELIELSAPTPKDSGTTSISSELYRILGAIEGLPNDEREAFQLVRLQGMTKAEAAEVIGISAKTVQRRLNRSLLMLGQALGDLGPSVSSEPD